VGYRLFLLVGCQTVIAAILVLTASGALSLMADDYRHMYEFQLQSISAIRRAMEKAESARDSFPTSELEPFYKDYRTRWEVASGNTYDAIRFRKDLVELQQTGLASRENEVLGRLDSDIQRQDLRGVREELADLYAVNRKYIDVANVATMNRMRIRRMQLIAMGTGGMLLTLFLGLHVRSAIAPRIQNLVGGVRRFQTSGDYEGVTDNGNDDIAVLAHALNAGFAAIALRDRERDHFLAIAAHELKTPVTSIQGYSSLLVDGFANPADTRRALEVIHRQSWRLSRMVEMMFLAMQARSRSLSFNPKPLQLSALVQQVLQEINAFFPNKAFTPQIQSNVSILGDQSLLEHAFWALFTCSAALCRPNTQPPVALCAADHTVSVTVRLDESAGSAHEIDQLFIPFQSSQYESAEGIRSAVGLFLCREIARVHNGRLYVRELAAGSEFVMELPV
jgi:signal transduction histidine kinase